MNNHRNKMNIYYKVVTNELKSLGLRKNPTILVYQFNKCIKSPTIKKGNSDDGGIWVVKTKSNANRLVKYMKKKYNKECYVFKAHIKNILYENNYRTKVERIKIYEH